MSSSQSPTATRFADRPSIIHPVVDFLAVGGLSLLVFVPMLLSGRSDLVFIGAGAQAFLATAINMPHFMASYRLVYRDRASILRHKWASLYVPAILIVYIVIALQQAQTSPWMVVILISVASAYLAWHYTGQVWGMMASYSYLGGTKFERSERLLIRAGLRILLAWHLTWFLYTQLRDPSLVRPLYRVISAGTVVAFALGAIGILKVRRRTGKFPPARALVAWLALFVWYAMLARDPKALFYIQIAHALQYLAFPISVEMNRASGDAKGSARRFGLHMLAYGGGLLAVSWVMSLVVPISAMATVADMFGEQPSRAAPILILMIINIHHYFTDGVIWKISNPEVRRDLFAHVAQPERGKGVSVPVGARDPGKQLQTGKTAARAKG
jgi:hypothetical protein